MRINLILYKAKGREEKMSLNQTPSGERLCIGIFGRRNAGKSSVINALTGQEIAIVSEVYGTTTDPVSKSMEILPIGPVVIIDTPGIDDCGELGRMRVQKAYQALNKVDIAIVVVDGSTGMYEKDEELIKNIKERKIPFIIVQNKADMPEVIPVNDQWTVSVSAKENTGIEELKQRIIKASKAEAKTKRIIGDKLEKNDFVVLVIPIDESAPKGRLILPQQQTIRDILESGAVAIAVRETELEQTLTSIGKKPKLIITDSQVFGMVSKIVPQDIPLTSFSILFSNYKGDLKTQLEGVKALESLKDGDRILISEGCTHHRQCKDIGTVKMPEWLLRYTGKDLYFDFTSGGEFPSELTKYALVIHCGGCMLNEREMKYRIKSASEQNVPIANYGTVIAHMNGILKRSVEIFPDLCSELK